MITQPGRALAASLAAAWLALIAYMTLRPTEAVVITPTVCIFCGPLGGTDFALNVVLFVPLGMALRWATGRWKVAAMAGMVITFTIEVLQWRLIAGRDASLGDLLANTLGTLLGAWIAVELFRWLNASGSAARRYAAIFGIVTTGVFLASAWLLLPVQPRFWQQVQWTPQPTNTDLFQGQVFAVDLNGRPIAEGELVSPPEMYDSVSHTMVVRATVDANPPVSRRPAVIVRISNYYEQGFALSQRGQQATFRTHLAAAWLKLRVIPVGLNSAFSASKDAGTDGQVTIEASANPRMMLVRRRHPGGESSVMLQRTVGLAWTLFMPWEIALGPRWWPASALWLATLLVPVSFFTVRSLSTVTGNSAPTRSGSDSNLPRFGLYSGSGEGDSNLTPISNVWPLTLVLSVLVATPLTGLSALGAGEWFGVVAGIVAGMILERATAMPAGADLKGVAPDDTILS